ncbi:MAG: hypothetical protein AUK44_05285 [Porphyromonadaceae bacterium CG2_30_38_12]|nr:MAG: hypothetical protein AUK44_05285 [Porphyromonadaceae bacterium CG2_30_38_12]
MKLKKIQKFIPYVYFIALCFWQTNLAAQNSKFTVVIDAGHGGHDPGAMGKITREKDINLAVSLQLSELIRSNNDDVRVVLTRSNDRYLTLQERADIVNNNHADLFICIHTNSAQSSSAYGAESFTLGLAKSKGNLDVAMRENSVMLLENDYKSKYKGFDPASVESYIMFEFMQDKYIDRSITFASDIQSHFKNFAHRSDRGVRQAGFWVLYRSACPSVLVELGFISNPSEEKYLASSRGQKEMAKAIYNAFVSFKYEHEKKSGKPSKKPNFYETESLILDAVGRNDSKADNAAPLKPVIADTKKAVVPLKEIQKSNLTPSDTMANQLVVESTKKPKQKVADKNKKEEKPVSADTSNMSNSFDQTISQIEEKSSIPKSTTHQTNTDINETASYKNKSYETIVKENPIRSYKPLSKPQKLSSKQEKYIDLNALAAATEIPIYKLQLFSRSKKLNSNAAEFRGIRNTDFYVEGGMYKYTLGADRKYETITKLRKEMLAIFPDAFVVAFLGKKKIPISEALKLTSKNK